MKDWARYDSSAKLENDTRYLKNTNGIIQNIRKRYVTATTTPMDSAMGETGGGFDKSLPESPILIKLADKRGIRYDEMTYPRPEKPIEA